MFKHQIDRFRKLTAMYRSHPGLFDFLVHLFGSHPGLFDFLVRLFRSHPACAKLFPHVKLDLRRSSDSLRTCSDDLCQ